MQCLPIDDERPTVVDSTSKYVERRRAVFVSIFFFLFLYLSVVIYPSCQVRVAQTRRRPPIMPRPLRRYRPPLRHGVPTPPVVLVLRVHDDDATMMHRRRNDDNATTAKQRRRRNDKDATARTQRQGRNDKDAKATRQLTGKETNRSGDESFG